MTGLDYLVCSVRDCFADRHAQHGMQSVNQATGRPSDLCYRRRARTDSRPTNAAKLAVGPGLISKLKGMLDKPRMHTEWLAARGFSGFEVVAAEDLIAFQTDRSKGVARSLPAWDRFFRSLGVTPKPQVIRQVLRKSTSTYTFQPHSKVIYNYAEVASLLTESSDPRLKELLRG